MDRQPDSTSAQASFLENQAKNTVDERIQFFSRKQNEIAPELILAQHALGKH